MRRLLSNLWYRFEHKMLDWMEAPESRALRQRLTARSREQAEDANWEFWRQHNVRSRV